MTEWIIFSCKEEIIKKRSDKGWSRLELAEYSGIHPNAIKEFEEGLRIPSNPIQMLLHRTFKRLDNTIDNYYRLSPQEQEKFRLKIGLIKGSYSITREE